MFGRKRRRLERWEKRGYTEGLEKVAKETAPRGPDNPILGEDTEPRFMRSEERLAYEAGKAQAERTTA